jgi:hypothetical protein
MPNVISSAIVNAPPPEILADVLNRRNKVHHFDKETDEDMIPLFGHGVEGKPRNNKRLLPHRNWCSIREYQPGNTPPPSPTMSAFEHTPDGSPPGSRSGAGGLLRRFSRSRRGPAFRGPDGVPGADVSRPPVSGGILRAFSRSRRASADLTSERPAKPGVARSASLGRSDGFLSRFRRRSSVSKPRTSDDGGINGQWGESDIEQDADEEAVEDEDDDGEVRHDRATGRNHQVGLRGGAGSPEQEYETGDDSYFSVRMASTRRPPGPAGKKTSEPPTPGSSAAPQEWEPKPFHRTPTGLSTKQRKRAATFEVNLEGGLEVCLNVEVSSKDPAGITVPYRLIVPKLWYDPREDEKVALDKDAAPGESAGVTGGIKRLFSSRKGKEKEKEEEPAGEEEEPET